MVSIEISIIIALVCLVIVYIYMAAFTSWHVAKSPYFEPGQKYAQYAIIWLIPILGAALVLHVLSPDVRRRRPSWIPWFDYLLVASFTSSASTELENAAAHHGTTDVDASIQDGGSHD
jgi:hypothetical protein